MRKVGVFGGSFDPIHLGHLLLAEYCREVAGLDEIRFVPTSQSPFKGTPSAPAKHRLEMVRLATWGNAAFVVDGSELERGGVNYTVDTLQAMADRHPQEERFLLLGSDSLADFGNWRQPQRICELATPLVVARGGSGPIAWQVLETLVGAERTAELRELAVRFRAVEISSTELRERVASGRSIRYQTPRAVEEYVRTHGLYRG
ncbi:MAG TPA: nicotinate-nucleotide adenylyltransferase [Pirellulaceae bacterium]|nr:nicotinate-nucleotide adenylyltransferase [Pirellulaceae bacterium]